MKRIMMMAAMVLLAGLAVSCQKEEIGVEDLPTFTAHADNGGMKTDLVGNIIHWNNTDQVKVFGNSGYAIYSVTPRPADPTWATLTPSEDHGITGSTPYRFVYPASMAEGGATNNSTLYVTYPAERNISDEPLKYYPMYGESDNHDVSFRNLGGLVKIVLPEIDREVAYIRVAADVPITGRYSFAADCSTMSYGGGTPPDTSIVISVNGNIAEGEEVYVAMPNREYPYFAITVYTNDGYVARKTGSSANVEQSAITTIVVSNLNFTAESFPAPTLRYCAFEDFNEQKPIVFHYNHPQLVVEGAERIDDGQNETPICRKINTNQVDVYTHAAQINAPANCGLMFARCQATSIDFGDGFNTENVTDMGLMFYYCSRLTSLNLSSFNTENVTDMTWMFLSCEKLTSLDLSSFNTSNVTDMCAMFSGCYSLTSLDLSHFNTSNVIDMSDMYFNCISLRSLNLSSFNTANVTNMGWMFAGCSSLMSLDLSSFNISNVTDMRYMFGECRKMTSIEFANTATINSAAFISSMLSELGTSATGGCTIHCNASVMNRLMGSSGYNATYVHFNTVY